ncbi:MAG: SDR family oxidoreductase [Gemmatimonas sp.]
MSVRADIAVTGATGQLGQLVVEALGRTEQPGRVRVIGRRAESLAGYAAKGLQTAVANYTDASALQQALAGVDRLLLISSSEIGQRYVQHKNVVDAAKAAGVKLIVYTSILRADSSEIGLAKEHLETETYIKASGIPFVFLRNGWYTENYTSAVQQGLSVGSFAGASADGRISSATRKDFADAAAAVIVSPAEHTGKIYELAGDESYTMSQFADAVAKARGKAVTFNNLPQQEYQDLLAGFGLPLPVASMLAQSDDAASRGALYDDTRTLSKLIGRPTTPLSEFVAGFAA